MNQERYYILALTVLAVLAAVPQIPVDPQIWGMLLAIIGIVAGVLLKYDAQQRTLFYVLTIALPVFSDSLTAFWVVGVWLDAVLDNLAIGVQGLAVGLFVMALLARIQGTRPATV